jgi:hypothetical protein
MRAKASVKLNPMIVVFFIEITSFLLDFSFLSVTLLTSEEKMGDRNFYERDELNRRVTSVAINSEEAQNLRDCWEEQAYEPK